MSNVEVELFCGDCLCRVCTYNSCGDGIGGCSGCASCTGVIEEEEDCNSAFEFKLNE